MVNRWSRPQSAGRARGLRRERGPEAPPGRVTTMGGGAEDGQDGRSAP